MFDEIKVVDRFPDEVITLPGSTATSKDMGLVIYADPLSQHAVVMSMLWNPLSFLYNSNDEIVAIGPYGNLVGLAMEMTIDFMAQ